MAIEESKGDEEREGLQQQRVKGNRRRVDAGLAVLPEEEEDEAPSSGSAPGTASFALPAGRGENPVDKSEIMANLASFFDDNVYLFIGGISRCWNKAWRWQRFPTETCGISVTTTPGQLLHSFACGLARSSSVCVAAAMLKKVDVVQVARDAGFHWHVDVAVWLVRGNLTNELKKACTGEDACPMGDKGNVGPDALLQLARGAGAPWDVTTSNRCFWKPTTCHQAAKAGQLRALKWAREKGCPWGPSTFYEAAKAGHWPILEYLASAEAKEDRCPWNERLCQGCAEGGHLAILTWARSAGCPWNKDTIATFATINGHLDILQYVSDQGCAVNADLENDPTVKKHAHAHRTSGRSELLAAGGARVDGSADIAIPPVAFAANQGQVDMVVKLLREQGANLKVPAPEALNENGGPWLNEGWRPLHGAARGGKVPAIHALLRAGADPNGTDAKGASPLMMATFVNAACVRALLEDGADPSLANGEEAGMSALLVGIASGSLPLVRLLPDEAMEAIRGTPAIRVALKFAIEHRRASSLQLLLTVPRLNINNSPAEIAVV
eukprot:g15136.t1